MSIACFSSLLPGFILLETFDQVVKAGRTQEKGVVSQDPSEVEGEPLVNIPSAEGLRPTLGKSVFILLT